MQLPPQFSLFGPVYPGRGGLLSLALREADGEQVLVCGAAPNSPLGALAQHFDAEVECVAAIATEIRAPRRLEIDRRSWLIYESIEGKPLDLSHSRSTEEFWRLALPLAEALAERHSVGQVHGRLEGSCFWYAQERTRPVAILGCVRREQSALVSRLPATADTAPELVGEREVLVEPSADVYSLGSIFYQLLSGRPPIVTTGSLAYDVAANAPAPLDSARVPLRLSELVLRMLSKSPASRPQSGAEVCRLLAAIRAGDSPPRLSIPILPSSLVGRSLELDLLLGAARAAGDGSSKLLAIAGEPGVGKSYLIGTFLSRLSSRSFLTAEGKFEQGSQGQPYHAMLLACRSAVGRALSGDEWVFTRIRERLVEANPTLLGVLSPYIHELKHLCGALPEPPEVGASENRNRFKRACLELLNALASPDLPVVLVLEDMQWADEATSTLLEELTTSGLPDRLLLVLSYRPLDAAQNSNFMRLLELLPAEGRIELEPFSSTDTEEFCRSLLPNCLAMPALAATLQQRSRGNALYCVELLRSLAASGHLSQVGERWSYAEGSTSPTTLSEPLIELIRARLTSESELTRYVMGAAACIGSSFSQEQLGEATALDAAQLTEPLAAAKRHGLIDEKSSQLATYAFCHDRIQESALTLLTKDELSTVRLRLGRYYRRLADFDQSALFQCIDHLNAVSNLLEGAELTDHRRLNWVGAKHARRAIAYKRALSSLGVYLESSELSRQERFEATLLLAECLLLSLRQANAEIEVSAAQAALSDCTALAESSEQRLQILQMELSICVSNQSYAKAVDLGLEALSLLGVSLPARPTMARVFARVAVLQMWFRNKDNAWLAQRGDTAPAVVHQATDVLMRLSAPAHWEHAPLGALVLTRLVDLVCRYGNGPQSSMAYASYGFILHMQGRHEAALRYGQLAESLAPGHSPYTRNLVRFQTLTFFGAFQLDSRTLLAGYDDALRDCVSHGELIASHLIDGAVTILPHFGPKLARVSDELNRYEREARAATATTSLEMIHLVRHWHELLRHGKAARAPEAGGLYGEVENNSFSAGRDMLRMQIDYLQERDEDVLLAARAVRRSPQIYGNPLHRASYAIFLILATTRARGAFTRAAKEALRFLSRLDAVRVENEKPHNFRASLLLAQGLLAHSREEATAVGLLEAAAAQAARSGQELLRAICLERLAYIHAAGGQYAEFVERLRDAAQAFQQFGADAKVRDLEQTHRGIDWTHLAGRHPRQPGIQVEGVMRAASAIAEGTSTSELGPTLLRVIATTASAMRAFLFVPVEGRFTLVAGCERDQIETKVSPTPLEEVSPTYLALGVVRYVERAREVIDLPRDQLLFGGDPYLGRTPMLGGLLCAPLLYRGEMVAILYLEGSCNAETFSAEDATLVSLLGRHAAIALTNADTHRLEIEALQSKVNPHFLYNALSVIAELISHSPDAAEGAVLKLTKLYRYMLSTSATQRVPLEKELTIVRDYLELEKARFGEKLRVHWDVQADVSRFQVPALLIQPLAENAVNHGIRRKVNGGTVSIVIREQGEGLSLIVRDDGPGWYAGSGGTGFGLRSVRRRLELVYGDRAQLEIIKGNGVGVELTLPW